MEMRGKRVVWVTYEEAQRLIPFFEYSSIHGPYKEARESASRILGELKFVRPMEYNTGGYQMFLKDGDYEFFIDTISAMGD